MFTYDCRTDDCEGVCEGSFGDPVKCPVCGACWETDWDYTDTMEGNMSAWITGPSTECDE